MPRPSLPTNGMVLSLPNPWSRTLATALSWTIMSWRRIGPLEIVRKRSGLHVPLLSPIRRQKINQHRCHHHGQDAPEQRPLRAGRARAGDEPPAGAEVADEV